MSLVFNKFAPVLLAAIFLPGLALAEEAVHQPLDLTASGVGSAAGVALMEQARGRYTFFSHLKWTPVIALGYAASIYVHMLINF